MTKRISKLRNIFLNHSHAVESPIPLATLAQSSANIESFKMPSHQILETNVQGCLCYGPPR